MKFKSALLGASALALIPLAAQAANWESVASSPNEAVFVDGQSIHREGDTLKAWVLRNYTRTSFLGDEVLPHKSRLMLYEFKCPSGELGYAQWSFHADQLGTGTTVWTGSASEVAFYKPDPNSADQALVAKVCAA